MNAVNPTLRTRYYKELTRRRKRLNGALDNEDDDYDHADIDPLDANLGDDHADRFEERDIGIGRNGFASLPTRTGDTLDNPRVASSAGGGAAAKSQADHRAANNLEKLTGEKASFASSSSFVPSHARMSEDSFEDSLTGNAIDAGGVFLSADGFGAMDLDGIPEGGTGTKMYTPAQKKAIVEYAVQYGERAAAKKFGVHRKNIYR